MNSFLSPNEIKEIGFNQIGNNVELSRKASIYSPERMIIGDNVRVDDFCILSGHIVIGSSVHISAYTGLFAGESGIFVDDYCTISSRCVVYAVSDDYSGMYMTNPTVPLEYRNVQEKPVRLDKYVIIGSGSTVLPGVILGEGVAVGSMSLVKSSLREWNIYAGIPCRKVKKRENRILEMVEHINQ